MKNFSDYAWFRIIYNGSEKLNRFSSGKAYGFSLRCLKGLPLLPAPESRYRERFSPMGESVQKPDGSDASKAPTDDLKSLSMPDLFAKLGVTDAGLTGAQAGKRLAQYGLNELAEKKANLLLKFLSYFWGPIPWMIEAAVSFPRIVRHWEDFGIILVLLLGNAVVGFWEEFQAGNAIAALKAQLALEARVKRDGEWTTMPARELVPGDLIRLRLGDIVPADARLLEGDPIEVDQSALTGESLPVVHKTGETVYSGSIVKQGEIDAVVQGTGKNTYFGKTAAWWRKPARSATFRRPS